MKTINVAAAKTAELLAFYNANADKQVSKFTNLATARRRVTALIESMELSAAAKPAPKAATKAAPKPAKAKAEPKPTEPKVRRSNAAGIAASWLDSEVREARLNRQAVVVVVGKKAAEYNSTRAAFDALGLPLSKSIRFRMKLKAAKKLTFTHAGKDYEFSIF